MMREGAERVMGGEIKCRMENGEWKMQNGK
jgi:hypothetical protein